MVYSFDLPPDSEIAYKRSLISALESSLVTAIEVYFDPTPRVLVLVTQDVFVFSHIIDKEDSKVISFMLSHEILKKDNTLKAYYGPWNHELLELPQDCPNDSWVKLKFAKRNK